VKSNSPSYDKENRVLSVVNDVTQGGESVKKNAMYKRFYDTGIANFYFYAPDSAFDADADKFTQMVLSFSTENLDSALASDPPKAADLDESILEGEEEGQSIGMTTWVPIFVVFLIIFIAARKKRARNQETS
jgi:hypothetical protein